MVNQILQKFYEWCHFFKDHGEEVEVLDTPRTDPAGVIRTRVRIGGIAGDLCDWAWDAERQEWRGDPIPKEAPDE